MFSYLKKGTITLATLAVVGLPMTAIAQTATPAAAPTARVQELPSPDTGMAVQAAVPTSMAQPAPVRTSVQTRAKKQRQPLRVKRVSKPVMAIRNDNSTTPLQIPAEYNPPAGTCRLWYPNRPVAQQPGLTDCAAAIPRGAIKLLG